MWAYVKHFDTFAHGLTESLRHPLNFDILMEVDEGFSLCLRLRGISHSSQLFKFRNAVNTFRKLVTIRNSCCFSGWVCILDCVIWGVNATIISELKSTADGILHRIAKVWVVDQQNHFGGSH